MVILPPPVGQITWPRDLNEARGMYYICSHQSQPIFSWVVAARCVGVRYCNSLWSHCMIKTQRLTVQNDQALSLVLGNGLVNILDSSSVEYCMDREQIDRSSVTMQKMFCMFNYIMSWWVIVLKPPGLKVFHCWKVSRRMVSAINIICSSQVTCGVISVPRFLCPSCKQLWIAQQAQSTVLLAVYGQKVLRWGHRWLAWSQVTSNRLTWWSCTINICLTRIVYHHMIKLLLSSAM